jgi:hypothetical protein
VVCVMSGMCAWLVASGRIPHVPTQQIANGTLVESYNNNAMVSSTFSRLETL